jgi:outer membrane lipoprotein-sorting protein
MKRRYAAVAWALGASLAWLSGPAPAQQPIPAAAPTAAQIVEKNASARGGTDAWRRIETMAWTGHVESTNARGHKVSFLLEQQRPHSTRFEILTEGQKSIRVYDGSGGWRMRATPGGPPELKPYTDEEMKYVRGAPLIEGPLMDSAVKGGRFTLLGVDTVGDRQAYVLDIKVPSGGMQRVWVDSETFYELRHDREYRNSAGQPAVASVFFRDYRAFEGLMLPVVIETGVVDGQAAHQLVIERVALNPALDKEIFTRPKSVVGRYRGGAVVDARVGAAVSAAPSVQR